MKQIVRIGVGQTAKVVAILYLIVTAVVAVLAAPFILLSPKDAAMPFGGAVMIVVLIAVPFFYAFVGYLVTALVSVIYNFVANRFGGIEIEIEDALSARS